MLLLRIWIGLGDWTAGACPSLSIELASKAIGVCSRVVTNLSCDCLNWCANRASFKLFFVAFLAFFCDSTTIFAAESLSSWIISFRFFSEGSTSCLLPPLTRNCSRPLLLTRVFDYFLPPVAFSFFSCYPRQRAFSVADFGRCKLRRQFSSDSRPDWGRVNSKMFSDCLAMWTFDAKS